MNTKLRTLRVFAEGHMETHPASSSQPSEKEGLPPELMRTSTILNSMIRKSDPSMYPEILPVSSGSRQSLVVWWEDEAAPMNVPAEGG